MSQVENEVRRIVESYVTQRDRLVTRHKILDVRQREMIAVQREHQKMMEAVFPSFPLAMWEGLHELSGLVTAQKAAALGAFIRPT